MDLKMRFNLIILIFFFTSCTTNYTKIDSRKPYNAKGFAYIFNQADRDKNIIKGKMNNNLLEISHSQLKYGATIKIINPKTKDTIVLKNTKKIKYPEFYKIVITDAVANKLNIDRRVPLIEVLEIRKNKSLINQFLQHQKTKILVGGDAQELPSVRGRHRPQWIPPRRHYQPGV